MIWNPETGCGRDGDRCAADAIPPAARACVSRMPVAEDILRSVREAVRLFLVDEDGGAGVDSGRALVLTARALTSIGEEASARRLLVCGTGLARREEWEFAGADRVWVLDLRKIAVSPDSRLELLLFAVITAALDAFADAWDDSAGRGILAVRHARSTAAAVLEGSKQNGKTVISLAREIMFVCGRKLDMIRAERGWEEKPFVVDLDME